MGVAATPCVPGVLPWRRDVLEVCRNGLVHGAFAAPLSRENGRWGPIGRTSWLCACRSCRLWGRGRGWRGSRGGRGLRRGGGDAGRWRMAAWWRMAWWRRWGGLLVGGRLPGRRARGNVLVACGLVPEEPFQVRDPVVVERSLQVVAGQLERRSRDLTAVCLVELAHFEAVHEVGQDDEEGRLALGP